MFVVPHSLSGAEDARFYNAEGENSPDRELWSNDMSSLRKRLLSRPLLRYFHSALPPLSDTEREALEAGGVWWDASLMTGRPDWDSFVEAGSIELSDEEQAFIDGPVEELCRMIDDWQIEFEDQAIPDEIWRFLKDKGFFGMIIPKDYDGLEFSATGHSEIVSRIATRSNTVAVTVMVPNSLGPGELLLEYGTDEQKDYYLPRLADGREIPAFGLTSPEAGSDAASMTDEGVVCVQEYNGERTLGIRLNWHKRYITLGPVSTILGLAFKLRDPDGLLGDEESIGITVALVPVDTPGVEIGARHYPARQAFQNGPNRGNDVFLPIDYVIGGQECVGQGWKMLMSALAAGRSISLPALSTGGVKLAARTTGAYARIREQFGIPVGKFEGVQMRLARLAGTAYVLDAARTTTALALDRGHVPAVISAILKSNATYRLRDAINDAMDVHGGKTICDGPKNYLGNVYRAVPVAITVEGSNILTRSMIIFGQGAIRCHPYLLDEMLAAGYDDERAVEKFDSVIFRHLGFQFTAFIRALVHGWTAGRLAAYPKRAQVFRPYYRQLSRYSATLTWITEIALLSLGGEFKRRELVSARLGDVLSELYLLSSALKRFEDDGRPSSDRPLVEWCMDQGLCRIDKRLGEVIDNFPARPLRWLMRAVTRPWGATRKRASDELTRQCAELLLAPGDTRERLTRGVFTGNPGDGIDLVERAFERVTETEVLRERMRDAGLDSVGKAREEGVLSDSEAAELEAAEKAVSAAIQVDHFDEDAAIFNNHEQRAHG